MTEFSTVELARVSVELTSPLSIGSGESDLLSDAPVVRDAQGLPTIPATSMIGVLRSLWQEGHTDQETEALFGYQKRDEGARSMVEASSGVIHDSHDCPVSPFADWHSDPLLQSAGSDRLIRDHVRLNHRGVVDGRGKFDRASIHKGHRFTFELTLRRRSSPEAGEPQKGDLGRILDLLSSTVCRFGAKTRSGLGSFKVVRCSMSTFDLTNKEDFNRYLSLPRGLHHPCSLEEYKTNRVENTHSITIELKPEEAWLQGGGDQSKHSIDGRGPKIVPYQERSVTWRGMGRDQKGSIDELDQDDFVLTGTSIRGALRHRTAFHFRRLIQHWSNPGLKRLEHVQEQGLDSLDPSVLKGFDMLFGQLNKSNTAGGQELGWRGSLLTSDVRVKEKNSTLQVSDHLSIDRFSGAPMQGHLFSDAAIAADTQVIPLELGFIPPRLSEHDSALADALNVACYALSFTIKDLSRGRLQLGAGSGRGYGYFSAVTSTWSVNLNSPWVSALNGVCPSSDVIARVTEMNKIVEG